MKTSRKQQEDIGFGIASVMLGLFGMIVSAAYIANHPHSNSVRVPASFVFGVVLFFGVVILLVKIIDEVGKLYITKSVEQRNFLALEEEIEDQEIELEELAEIAHEVAENEVSP